MADLRQWTARTARIYVRAVVVVTIGFIAYTTVSTRSYWNVTNLYPILGIAAVLTTVTILAYAATESAAIPTP